MARAAPVVAVARRRAGAVAEEKGHGGFGQQEQADRGRDDEGQHGRQPAREAGQEGGVLAGGPTLGQVGRDHRHDGDGDDPVGHLQEGVGVGVGGDRVGAARGARRGG